ncbi:NUDIX domain-containing protein [Corynebacterium riegelii]
MLGDGNGWVHHHNHKYWGLHGAAGLFLLADAHVLLQHRAPWTADGDTWGIPGGARDSHETGAEAALRETVEECGIDPSLVTVVDSVVTFEVPGWSYTTVIASAESRLPFAANEESVELRWVPLEDLALSGAYAPSRGASASSGVMALPLHPGFAASLPTVLARVGHTNPHD